MRDMEQQSVKQIGIAVVERHGTYLVGVRAAGQVLAGHAEFPGGKCDPGELPAACAVRECREETGLTVVAERLLDVVPFQYPHGAVALHFWLCRVGAEPEHRTDPQGGFRWVPARELAALDFPEANRAVVARLATL